MHFYTYFTFFTIKVTIHQLIQDNALGVRFS
jgi:hypothetical protein